MGRGTKGLLRKVPVVPLWTGIIRAKIVEDGYRPVVGLDR